MKREFNPDEPELMDLPQPVSEELETDLTNLQKLNQYFGSYSIIKRFLNKWLTPKNSYTILDVATGSGDIPRFIVDLAKKRGVSIQIDALDSHPSTLAIAKNRSSSYPEVCFIEKDARSYRPGKTYDIVICSLALHHFSESDAIVLLKRFKELSHDKVLVTDLHRSWFTWISVYLVTTFVFREPMTKYDARLSVRRAFSKSEFHNLATQAGWTGFQHRLFFPARQALSLEEIS